MVVAVHEEIRTSPSEVSAQADHVTKRLSIVLAHAAAKAGIEAPGLTVGLRYMRLSQYLGEELPRRLSGQPRSRLPGHFGTSVDLIWTRCR